MTAAPITRPIQRTAAGGALILPPASHEMLEVCNDPGVPRLVGALGAHGGAGTSTLAAMLDPVGDCGRRWPGRTDESPFVVLVARESARGLDAAQAAARQYLTGNTPDHIVLLGLVLVATHRGNKHTAALRQSRELICGPGLFTRVWSIGWHQPLIDRPIGELPHIGPDAPPVKKPHPMTDVPADIAALGRELRAAAVTALQNRSHP